MNEWRTSSARCCRLFDHFFFLSKKEIHSFKKKKVVIFPRDLIYFPLLIVSIPFFFFLFLENFLSYVLVPKIKMISSSSSSFFGLKLSSAYLRLVVAFAGFKQQQTDRTTRNISSFFLSFYSTTVTVVYVAVVIVLELAKRHFFFFFFSGAGGVKREREKGLTLGYRSPDRSHWSYCKCALLLLLLLLQFPTTDDEKRMGIWERWLAADVHWELGERNVSCSLKGD